MKTKIWIVIAVVIFASLTASAQIHIGKSRTPLFFDEYQTAEIVLSTGRTIKQRQANIFLKNSSLLYKNGKQVMQANVDVVSTVRFGDVQFLKVDTLLAYVVDSVIISDKEQNLLVCARLIDMPAYRQQVTNSRNITNLSLGDMVGSTSTDVAENDQYEFPVINNYFYRLNGKFVRVHERDIKRVASKEQFRLVRSIMLQPEFTWSDEKALIQILGILSKDR